MPLTYFAGDERPYWEPVVTVAGVAEDMTTGFTFEVNLATTATATPALTKTTGITGGPAGAVEVAWAVGDLALEPCTYVAQLTCTRTSDSKDWTIEDTIQIKPRMA